MSYEVLSISIFDRQVKRLAKKHVSLKKDITTLTEQLKGDPKKGVHLGNNFYKIRLAISSKGKGKSGGARVITYFKIKNEAVYLSFIYDKSEKSNITQNELDQIFKLIP